MTFSVFNISSCVTQLGMNSPGFACLKKCLFNLQFWNKYSLNIELFVDFSFFYCFKCVSLLALSCIFHDEKSVVIFMFIFQLYKMLFFSLLALNFFLIVDFKQFIIVVPGVVFFVLLSYQVWNILVVISSCFICLFVFVFLSL